MTALTKEQRLKIASTTAQDGSAQMDAVKIFQGAVIGIRTNGYARPFATGDFFGGHAKETLDNSAGAAGDKRIERYRGVYCITVPNFSSATVANIGDPVWTSTDNHADLTLTDPGTTKTTTDLVGYVVDVLSTGEVVVECRTRQV